MGTVIQKESFTFDDVLILPAASSIEPREATTETAIARGFFISIPIISAAMDTVSESMMAIGLGRLGGLCIVHRSNSIEEEVAIVRKAKKAGVRVGAACSPFDIERAKKLVTAGADVIAVDSAHGHNANVIKGSREIKKAIGKVPLLVGNIATAEAAKELVKFADGIKVGIGPGSICTTRIVSGVGVPQFSAIQEVVRIAKRHGVPVIADGGIRNSGDIAKALGAGASAVMLGNLLAGTDAAPGKLMTRDGKKFKEYRGMGSRAVLEKGVTNDRYLGKSKRIIPEGVSGLISYKGTLESVIDQLVGGIQVSMGYVGAKTLVEFEKKARFIRISPLSIHENRPHSLSQIIQ